jgi:DNA-binding response OmpR family regulator
MTQQPATLLVVDDEADILDLMRDFLSAEGFAVVTAADAGSALATLDQTPIDCLLLDVMLPGASGFDLCRQIRQKSDVPILFLTARDGDADKIRGLSLGGDDYITKAASLGEVSARIRAVLRRARRGSANYLPATLDFGRLVIDLRAHEVRVAGQVVPFTPREYRLLLLLAEHPRQVFTRDQIFAHIWGDYGERHTVTVHINRIREKIEADPSRPEYITTVWGLGYRFEGVRR